MDGEGHFRRNLIALILAVVLLGVFILVNSIRSYQSLHAHSDPAAGVVTEILPSFPDGKGKNIAFFDFEQGNAADTASHLAFPGHGGKQSLRLSPKVPFSPGLWTRYKDLKPGDSTWIRATGYVMFSCPVPEAKCSLVATCNRNGVNYKYMSVPIEKGDVKPGQWNKISIEYHVPQAPDPGDVVQVYFWYRGSGEMLVDDIRVEIFTP
jgi:hypothetical protein